MTTDSGQESAEEGWELALFCSNGEMHCTVDNDCPLTAAVQTEVQRSADRTHPTGAPHRLKVRRVLRYPWTEPTHV